MPSRSPLFALVVALPFLAASPHAATITLSTANDDAPALVLSGVIVPADICGVATALAAHPAIRRIRIASPGGDAWAGARIGRLLSDADMEADVAAGTTAASAAAVAVLGAPRRRINGVLALHGPSIRGSRIEAMDVARLQETVQEMRNVLAMAGMPSELISQAMNKGPSQFLILTAQDVQAFAHHGTRDPASVGKMARTCQDLGDGWGYGQRPAAPPTRAIMPP